MSQPFLGQILMFGGNFPPRGYALCNGQTLGIIQNTALFSVIGTTYGGNGQTTFQLPNLQSSLPLGFGHGFGLSDYVLGQVGGSASVTLDHKQVPSHAHVLMASTSAATSTSIANNLVPGTPTADQALFYANPPGPSQPPLIPHVLAAGAVSTVGAGAAHPNLMPSLCITFAIALQGVFPSRN